MFPTVNTSRMKFDSFTVGDRTDGKQTKLQVREAILIKNDISLSRQTTCDHSQQLKQHSETTNSTTKHN